MNDQDGAARYHKLILSRAYSKYNAEARTQ